MVNTFLTASPNDIDKNGLKGYRISANNLDKSRLWKQALEALQILNLIKSFEVLAEVYKSPCPKNPYKIKDWINTIMKQYKSLNYYLFLHQKKYMWYKKDRIKPKKIKYDEEYKINDDGTIFYNGKNYPKYSLVLPGDNFMSLGFYSHPVVVMWMNHSESLKLYINCHIDEFLVRGGKPGVEKLKFKINENNIEHPIWTLDPEFHKNHKAALLTKEIVRKESEWYIKKRDFKIAYNYYIEKTDIKVNKSTSSFQYYIWPFTQDIDNPRYLDNKIEKK